MKYFHFTSEKRKINKCHLFNYKASIDINKKKIKRQRRTNEDYVPYEIVIMRA